ncbi:Pantothenate kinase PanK [Handroanthus impetiginosus]|uniref:Pantothenate kinase PanK n=1 Tax=Handroanthus impetiginosus TaxID=429701 RepID=A0A2G9GYH3_9LAMI|nr:Pantothenate kinase PanK [Handroanthus impetiginosus]
MEGNGIQVAKLEEKKLKQYEDEVSHLALDIGGSLIKVVYFSSSSCCSSDDEQHGFLKDGIDASSGNLNYRVLTGRLHFLKFETSKISECIKFLSSKRLQHYGHQDGEAPASEKRIVKATGGGAFKFADLFKEKLGIVLDKVDEMRSLVAGANFLLKAVQHEAFTYMDGQKEYVQIDHRDLYPYLLVNIGSGVSMIKVDGDNEFQRISGTSVGGGTFGGLGKLLTKCKSFDELLELSRQGNNRVIDMLVGDIYGGMDYSKIGLSSTAIASSFGKAISENKELEDYRAEDIARSLLRMISNNIGQIAYLNALRFGLKRIFFGGFFIRGHAYTMDTISVAVNFWSKGEAKALFLHHEGFLGALGAFLSYEKNAFTDFTHQFMEQHSSKSESSCSTGNGFESLTCDDVKDSGFIECRVQVRN